MAAARTKVHTGIVKEYAKIGETVYALDHIKYTSFYRGDALLITDILGENIVYVEALDRPHLKREISSLVLSKAKPIENADKPIPPETPFALFNIPLNINGIKDNSHKYFSTTVADFAEHYNRFLSGAYDNETKERIENALKLYYSSHNLQMPVQELSDAFGNRIHVNDIVWNLELNFEECDFIYTKPLRVIHLYHNNTAEVAAVTPSETSHYGAHSARVETSLLSLQKPPFNILEIEHDTPLQLLGIHPTICAQLQIDRIRTAYDLYRHIKNKDVRWMNPYYIPYYIITRVLAAFTARNIIDEQNHKLEEIAKLSILPTDANGNTLKPNTRVVYNYGNEKKHATIESLTIDNDGWTALIKIDERYKMVPISNLTMK